MSVPPQKPSRPISPDDVLPPVEPPSAGFIVQLFVVPAVIVCIIVMVWLLFNWVAQMGSDPQQFVEALRRNNPSRWQAAVNLANELRNPRNAELKTDEVLARQLGDILQEELTAAQYDPNSITLRIFLCRALGEFHVPQVLPGLVKVAGTQRDPAEAEVRRAAIESIAVLHSNLPALTDAPQQQTIDVLLKAAREPSTPDDAGRGRLLRSTAAFTLGVVGGEEAKQQLRLMLADSHPDVRYNAAAGLARHGDEQAIEVLIAMLDPEQRAGVEVEQHEAARDYKRHLILSNALRATSLLAAHQPTADLSELRAAVSRLAESKRVAAEIRVHAKEVLKQLQERT